MNAQTDYFLIQGDAGKLDCALDLPDPEIFPAALGLALVAHPHPLFGGTMDNKVAQTIARSFVGLGYATARMNFRGVGKSEGVHDHGIGETDDMETLLLHLRQRYADLPLVLGGFSFGTFVQSRLQQRLLLQHQEHPKHSENGLTAQRMVLVGAAAGKWAMPEIPANTILIHGEQDDTIPLQAVYDWLRPQDIGVFVVPGADHFFHRKLHHIKNTILSMWHA